MEGVVAEWDVEKRCGKIKQHRFDKKWFFVHYKAIMDGDTLNPDPGSIVTFSTKAVRNKGYGSQVQASEVHGGFWSKSRGHLAKLGFDAGVQSPLVAQLIAREFADSATVCLTRSGPVGGYSKLKDGTAVALQLPIYTPKPPGYKLEKDEWEASVSGPDAGIYERLSQILDPSEFQHVECLTDRNNLMKLLTFLDYERHITDDRFVFKIDAHYKHGMLALERVDLSDPQTGMPINHVLSYGFAYEREITTPSLQAEKHVVIQKIGLQGLQLLVRCEVDASAAPDMQELMEIKTGNVNYRDAWYGWKKAAIQMHLGGSAKLVMGWHNKGEVRREDVLSFEDVQSKAENYDKKFGALANLLRRIREISKMCEALELIYSPPERGELGSEAELFVYGNLRWEFLPSSGSNYVRLF
ncbi:Scn11a [Symbiodinium sp. CCMP2592]|nr:Scn11a [Symbiodinium sp. CCMP2592]